MLKFFKTKIKQIFCPHNWIEVSSSIDKIMRLNREIDTWSGKMFKTYHCIKCDKHIVSTDIPLSYIV